MNRGEKHVTLQMAIFVGFWKPAPNVHVYSEQHLEINIS